MRVVLTLIGVLLLSASGLLHAQTADSRPPFPELTGPVVDRAGLLSETVEAQLSQELRAYARGSSNQVVVVTLETLDGYPIEQYGYQLGRHWGIGQKGEDNGALLLIDYGERELRIEVGYGLEGRLTDAASSNIIRNVIVPRFQAGEYEQGIVAGTHAILQVLGGESAPAPPPSESRGGISHLVLMLLVFGFGFLPALLGGAGFRHGRRRRGHLGGIVIGGGMLGGGFGGGGGGFGGGGFSGGGGGFGGGGASGGW